MMPLTPKPLRAPSIAFIAFTIFLLSGCNPEDKKSSETTTSSSQPKTDNDVSSANVSETKNDGDPVRIDGDLGSVEWNSMIGQNVTISGNLVVVDTYDLARRGQVKVARKRLYIPTNQIDPNDSDSSATSFTGGSNVGNVTKAQKENNEATLIIDDGSDKENIFPPTLFPNLGTTHPTVRIGSILNGVSGRVVKERNQIMLVPKDSLRWTSNERPQRPTVGEANLTLASFNVLNYFTTIDDGRNNARGADSESELTRQEAKLVAAIIGLQADIVGLMELENNLDAEKRLINALNLEFGKDVFTGCGLPQGFRDAPGGRNAIRVGIIYRVDRVEPVGDVSMVRDEAFDEARTPIVQSFKSKSAGEPFTLIVNHFKSKGGSNRADSANKDQGDGQGAYNATRRSQSLAICNYIKEQGQDNEAPRVLVIGDLNAYGQEDPIDAMRANGLVDLQERFAGQPSSGEQEEPYSFVYYGQCGSLDHAMATESMAAEVTGIATWHINADEPRFLDYNEEYNPKTLYQTNVFRSSDHDPVLIGIK